jgi:hypothetical protein
VRPLCASFSTEYFVKTNVELLKLKQHEIFTDFYQDAELQEVQLCAAFLQSRRGGAKGAE